MTQWLKFGLKSLNTASSEATAEAGGLSKAWGVLNGFKQEWRHVAYFLIVIVPSIFHFKKLNQHWPGRPEPQVFAGQQGRGGLRKNKWPLTRAKLWPFCAIGAWEHLAWNASALALGTIRDPRWSNPCDVNSPEMPTPSVDITKGSMLEERNHHRKSPENYPKFMEAGDE